MIEGKFISNIKYGQVKCITCKYTNDGFEFKKIFSNKLQCLKCKSNNIILVKKPKILLTKQ